MEVSGLQNWKTYFAVVTAENPGGEGFPTREIRGTPRELYEHAESVRLYSSGYSSGSEHFGRSVPVDGDYIAVGAYRNSAGGFNLRGAVYVYQCEVPGQWDPICQLTTEDPQNSAYFGQSVSNSGEYLVEGAPGVESSVGTVFVHRRSGFNSWNTGTRLTAPTPKAGADFGENVSIYGDYLAVGNQWSTEAYVYRRTTQDNWDSVAVLTAPESNFAYSEATNGDYVVLGAPGAVFVFQRTGLNTLDTGTNLIASDPVDSDSFGDSVAIGDDFIIFGAPLQTSGGISRGSAYCFKRTGANSWSEGVKPEYPDPDDHDFFGCSVAVSGDLAAIGAYGDDDLYNGAGAFYVYERQLDDSWSTTRKVNCPWNPGDCFR